MSPKKALYFSIGIRMLMVFFCISICFVKFIESDDETKQGLMEKDKTALVLAVEKVEGKACENLLLKGVTPDGSLADGSTPLHLASLNSQGDKSYALLRLLLVYNANPLTKDHQGRTPLHCACTNTKNITRRNDTVGQLLLSGADIKAENNNGRDILSDIVTLQSRDNVEDVMLYWGYLFSKEALEKAKKLAGSSAGVGLGLTDIYEVLNKYDSISKEALLEENVKRTGLPALCLKVLKGDWIEPVDRAEKEGSLHLVLPEKYAKMSLLFVAILRGEKKLAKRMLINKIGINHIDEYKRNALHFIVGSSLLNEKEKTKLLDVGLKNGCKVVSDKNGDTILHMAARNNYVEIVSFLRNSYKDIISLEHINVHGDRAFDIANRYGKSKLIALLR